MIELCEVTVCASKDGANNAIVGLSLRLDAGTRTAILGAHASGRAVLGPVVAGLISPDSGAVHRSGEQVSYISCNPDDQFICHSVDADVAFSLECKGLEPSYIRERVQDTLAKLGIMELATKAPHQLSGGQKQMVALAGAIAGTPDYLILDEATSMIDQSYRKHFDEVVSRLQDDGLGVVELTSDAERATLADSVVLLGPQGKILAHGTPNQVLSDLEALDRADMDPTSATKLWMSGLIPQRSGRDIPVTISELRSALSSVGVAS